MNRKVCKTCLINKPLSSFHRKISTADGLQYECKQCAKERRTKADNIFADMNGLNYSARNCRRNKIAVLEAYSDGSPKCECCGEEMMEFLSIDHSRNDGAAHRVKLNGSKFYRWLTKNNFPQNLGLRVLCHNCNISHGHYGYCPHKANSKFRDVGRKRKLPTEIEPKVLHALSVLERHTIRKVATFIGCSTVSVSKLKGKLVKSGEWKPVTRRTRWPKFMKLKDKTNSELTLMREVITSDDVNRNPPGSFWKYKPSARRKLDAIDRAITANLRAAKIARGEAVNDEGYSGRQTNRR